MKKWTRIAIGIALCVFMIQGLALPAASQADMPVLNIGDRWDYKSTTSGFITNMTFEVSDQTTINVNGTNYQVWEIEIDAEMNVMGFTATISGYNYNLRSNLATVKNELTTSVMGIGTTVTITYDPPKMDFDFPLDVGKTWSSSYKQTTTTTLWDTEEIDIENITMNCSVIGMETITVEAGTFECYKIEADDNEGTLITAWYSPDVKMNVKEVTSTYGFTSEEMELVDYSFDGGSGDGEEGGFNLFSMPYILLLVLIIIIVIIIVAAVGAGRRKKAKAQAPPASTPQQPYAATAPATAPTTPTPPPRPQQPYAAPPPATAPRAPPPSQPRPRQPYAATPTATAPTTAPPPPPPPQRPPPPKQYPCAACGQPLTYVQQYKRWYCNNCRKYA